MRERKKKGGEREKIGKGKGERKWDKESEILEGWRKKEGDRSRCWLLCSLFQFFMKLLQ